MIELIKSSNQLIVLTNDIQIQKELNDVARTSLRCIVMSIVLKMTVTDRCKGLECAIHISIDMLMHKYR